MKFSDLNLLNQLRKTAFVETAIASKELADNLEKGARPVLGFYIMLGLSTTIATFGLLSNSVGIIIGAMIVAPLMNPIVALSFGISCGNLKISKSSLVTLVSGILFTVVMAYLGTKLIGFRIASEEIIGRTNPSLLDLGVAIAAGGAAAFAYSRKSIANALAGAAIAVALVPPLCVVGIGLAVGAEVVPDIGLSISQLGSGSNGYDIASGAALLFLTNLFGIVIMAQLIFTVHGYGTIRKGIFGFMITFIFVVAILFPLQFSFNTMLIRNSSINLASRMMAKTLASTGMTARVRELRVYESEGIVTVDGVIMAPKSRRKSLPGRIEVFRKTLSEKLNRPVNVTVEIYYVEFQIINSGDQRTAPL